jgi:hypothetical protein
MTELARSLQVRSGSQEIEPEDWRTLHFRGHIALMQECKVRIPAYLYLSTGV